MEDIKCYRCGYCCYHLRAAIINPYYIEEVKTLKDIKEGFVKVKEPFEDCPYLIWENHNTTKCTIHNYNIFKYTFCYHFFKNFPGENYCLIGKNIKEKNLNTKTLC